MNSQDNKQLVMRAYRMYQDNDIQGLLALFADDIQWIAPEAEHIPFAGRYQGKDQVAQFFTQLADSVEVIQFEPETFVAEGNMVTVTGQSRWLVKATGQQYENPWAHVFTVRNGKVTRLQQYNDTAATEAAFRPSQLSSQQKEVPLRH